MYDQDCLIKVKQHNVSSYNLRSLAAPRIELLDKYELTTFQDQAASVFNNLPTEIRLCTDFTMFHIHLLERNIFFPVRIVLFFPSLTYVTLVGEEQPFRDCQ